MFLLLFAFLQYNLSAIGKLPRGSDYPYLLNTGIIVFLALVISPAGWVFLPIVLLNNIIFTKATFRELFIPLYTLIFCALVYFALAYIYDQLPAYFEWIQRPSFSSIRMEV